MMEAQILQFLQSTLGSSWGTVAPVWPAVWALLKVVAVLVPVVAAVAYLPYFERKVIAYMHVRIGPNRVGPAGLLQPIADALKLVFKEIIVPTQASKALYILGPILALAPALVAWAVIPFDDGMVIADVDAGVLFLLAVSSLGIYGIIVSGWASNSKYAFLGAMRAAAQMISYEIAMGMALIVVSLDLDADARIAALLFAVISLVLSLKSYWNALEKNNIVVSSSLGNAKFYQINLNNEETIKWCEILLSEERRNLKGYSKIYAGEIQKFEHAELIILFGSVLSNRDFNDVDVLFITNKPKKVTKFCLNISKIRTKPVFPLILKKIPQAKVYIVGNSPPKALQDRSSENVIVTGFVDDVRFSGRNDQVRNRPGYTRASRHIKS